MNIKPISDECTIACNGLMITSYSKSEFDGNLNEYIKKSLTDYEYYKGYFDEYPLGLKGKITLLTTLLCILYLDYQWENKLRYVRIYFDTPTFDKIPKDRAAKFVDMLSAIGGTMGLLTGFSIISGVEILYFSAKIFLKILRKKDNIIKAK